MSGLLILDCETQKVEWANKNTKVYSPQHLFSLYISMNRYTGSNEIKPYQIIYRYKDRTFQFKHFISNIIYRQHNITFQII